MPPFRMPGFGRKTQTVNGIAVDESQTPLNGSQLSPKHAMSVTESRRPSAININPKKNEPEEFKLGVVDDSGAFVPPSPPEKKSMWRRTPTSTTTSSHRSMISDNDGFSISRESFESYRRSFDISARSPIIHPSEPSHSRLSLDSARTPNTPRSIRQASNRSMELARPPKTVEEEREEAGENGDTFEDVGLEDGKQQSTTTTKKSLFSRFMKDDTGSNNASPRPGSGHSNSRFHLPGRKRGQSGQGAELGDMPSPIVPVAAAREEVPAEGTGAK